MITFQAAFDEYLLACAADGLSPVTIKWYRSPLSAFERCFAGRDLDTITAREIRQYIVGLQSRDARYVGASQRPVQPGGLSQASVAGHIRALHAFWAWAAREYRIPDPMVNIRRQRAPEPEPKAIAATDFIRLFEATGDDDMGKRDRAILAFLADTGCRVGGLVSLTLEMLDIDRGHALVIEKGKQKRLIVFTAYTGGLIVQWLLVRDSPSRYVFTSLTTGKPLTKSGVNQILERLKARAHVTGRANPHSFRHNFAREYLRNGGDLATLARLLGHSDISTTAAYYAVFSQDDLAEFHEKFSPLHGLIGLIESNGV